MGFNLRGEIIENCSCNALCPCWFGVKDLMKMDKGWCDSTLLFRIGTGASNGVDLSGATVVLAAAYPGPTLLDGNGTARLHVDASASDAQRRELETVFQGRAGGPMEILAGLITTWLPTNVCPIAVRDDGDTLTAMVGNVGEIRSEVLKDEAGERQSVRHAGFARAFQFDDLSFDVAPSGTRWTDPEMPRSFVTHSGVRATWTWNVS